MPVFHRSPFSSGYAIRFVSVLLSIHLGRDLTTRGLDIYIVSFYLSPEYRATYTKNVIECTTPQPSKTVNNRFPAQ